MLLPVMKPTIDEILPLYEPLFSYVKNMGIELAKLKELKLPML